MTKKKHYEKIISLLSNFYYGPDLKDKSIRRFYKSMLGPMMKHYQKKLDKLNS